jgi:hypothetical protein
LLAAAVTHLCEHIWIALTIEDGADDLHAGDQMHGATQSA